jgi:hypothetical protein
MFLYSAALTAQNSTDSQPPLSSNDLETFKLVMKKTVAAGDDQSKLENVYKEAAAATNSTENRAIFVVSKISLIQSLLAQPDSSDSIIESLGDNKSLVPSESEIDLVKANLSELYDPK